MTPDGIYLLADTSRPYYTEAMDSTPASMRYTRSAYSSASGSWVTMRIAVPLLAWSLSRRITMSVLSWSRSPVGSSAMSKLVHQRAGDGDAPHFTAGQLARVAVCQIGNTKLGEQRASSGGEQVRTARSRV